MPDRSRVMTQIKRDTLALKRRPKPTQGCRADDDDDDDDDDENCLMYIKLKALPCCGTTGLTVGVLVFAMVLGATLVMLTKPATQYIF